MALIEVVQPKAVVSFNPSMEKWVIELDGRLIRRRANSVFEDDEPVCFDTPQQAEQYLIKKGIATPKKTLGNNDFRK